MLPKEAVIEFQRLYEEMYKEKLSFEQAEKEAIRVFEAVKATYQPIKKEWFEKLGKKKKYGKRK